MKETIGWIGVGSMGHRMSRHLAKAGYPLVMADAVSTARAPEGATIAKSNAEVAGGADTIILSLPDGAVSEAVAREIAAAKPRRVKTVIDTSTIGIKAAEAVAALLQKAGIEFVDAPVSGGTAGADKATIAIMVACPKEAYGRFQPLLALMGKPFHVGPKPGQGQAVKILNNFLSATALAATLQPTTSSRTASCTAATTRASRPSCSSRTSGSISRMRGPPELPTRSRPPSSMSGSAWRRPCRAPTSRRCIPSRRRAGMGGAEPSAMLRRRPARSPVHNWAAGGH
jgi:3-hydroxyisobutyrate dehydrogenase